MPVKDNVDGPLSWAARASKYYTGYAVTEDRLAGPQFLAVESMTEQTAAAREFLFQKARAEAETELLSKIHPLADYGLDDAESIGQPLFMRSARAYVEKLMSAYSRFALHPGAADADWEVDRFNKYCPSLITYLWKRYFEKLAVEWNGRLPASSENPIGPLDFGIPSEIGSITTTPFLTVEVFSSRICGAKLRSEMADSEATFWKARPQSLGGIGEPSVSQVIQSECGSLSRKKRDRSKWKPERRSIVEQYERECRVAGVHVTTESIFEKAGISQDSNGYAALRGAKGRDAYWQNIHKLCTDTKPHLR
jgi:hypothetical protein